MKGCSFLLFPDHLTEDDSTFKEKKKAKPSYQPASNDGEDVLEV